MQLTLIGAARRDRPRGATLAMRLSTLPGCFATRRAASLGNGRCSAKVGELGGHAAKREG
ncbi:hypothetical protein NB231_09543 [Nitrococcus mobilis Nb-231]|uniref:Uncharacterized protein n=1 Tax=Nitrococcus mobilis Nb-231 TaxID=314278 RepID=A4BN86_9GAMM|nr:hypothetical protein NB231_09543 [Nitrococcus mobilis Nb-231]